MKKIIALILATLLLSLSLVACENKDDQSELDALNMEFNALESQFNSLDTPSVEMINAFNTLKNNVVELKVNTKDFDKKVTEYRAEITKLYAQIDDAKLAELVTPSKDVTNYVVIKVKNYGSMIVELYPETAPITVENFQTLVSQGFYDGLIFHRVIKDFMIQGGDPKGDGTGGSSQTIKGEFSSNGFQNDLKHTRGVISMARSDNPNSASSQFFIMHGDKPQLDGDYAAFGMVVSGMATVDGIANIRVAKSNPFSEKSTPVNTVKIEKAEFVSYVGQ